MPRHVLAAATAWPLVVAAVVLELVPPVNVRAAANAAASAAFCVWVLATITMPRSIARAMKPSRATMEMATYGKTTPRRALISARIRIVVSLSLASVSVQLASLDITAVPVNLTVEGMKSKGREQRSKLGLDLNHDARPESSVVPVAVGRRCRARCRVYLHNHHVGRD